jgi:hypothetical protein
MPLLSTHRFYAPNPRRDPLKPCVYVGMTGLPVDHRLENHKKGLQISLGREKIRGSGRFRSASCGRSLLPLARACVRGMVREGQRFDCLLCHNTQRRRKLCGTQSVTETFGVLHSREILGVNFLLKEPSAALAVLAKVDRSLKLRTRFVVIRFDGYLFHWLPFGVAMRKKSPV